MSDTELIVRGWSYGSVSKCEIRLTMNEISWTYENKGPTNFPNKSTLFPLNKITLHLTKGEKGFIKNSAARLNIIKNKNESNWKKWTIFFDYEQNKEVGEFIDNFNTFKKNKLESDELKEKEETIRVMKLKAEEREKARDYEPAIEIWEELGEITEAARVRKMHAEMGAVKIAQNVVHGDYVDDRDTIVKDSVVSKSNIGSGDDKLTKIKELKELHDSGTIDDDEFKQMKKEILE